MNAPDDAARASSRVVGYSVKTYHADVVKDGKYIAEKVPAPRIIAHSGRRPPVSADTTVNNTIAMTNPIQPAAPASSARIPKTSPMMNAPYLGKRRLVPRETQDEAGPNRQDSVRTPESECCRH